MEIAEYLRSEPMATRQGFFDDLIIIGSKLPWRVAAFSAVGIYVGLHMVAVQTSAPPTETTLADLAGVVQHTFIHVVASFLQYLLPIGLLIGAIVGVVGQSRARTLVGIAQANPKAIAAMTWRDFERVIGVAFRQQGFTVTELGGNGPDGGVDLVLTKDGARHLVQCKHWKQWKVGVAVVRELYGVIGAKGAQGGYVITGGRFTGEARDFARDTGVTLIDGSGLGKLLGSVGEPATSEVTAKEGTTPACPQCGGEMVERTATRGQFIGQPFWGCRKYPQCRGIARISQ
jgi:restriction system protein